MRPVLRCQTLSKCFVFTLRSSSSPSCMNKYLAVDSDGYLCTNSVRVLIAAWLYASQRSRDGVQYARSCNSHAPLQAEGVYVGVIRSQRPPIDSNSDEGFQPVLVQGNVQLKEVSFCYPSRPDVQVGDQRLLIIIIIIILIT